MAEFPLSATIAGVEVVTIPATEYAELLDCRRRAAERDFEAQRFMTPLRSRLDLDPEVAVFVAERLGGLTVAEVNKETTARFGAARTPARSSIHRYWMRLRQARRVAARQPT
ncbi:MAG: hypothetical protein H0T75_10170 [Rhizobiales bacterium]|nr:hypothetical protein [Hyphomicrobiales bacterium]